MFSGVSGVPLTRNINRISYWRCSGVMEDPMIRKSQKLTKISDLKERNAAEINRLLKHVSFDLGTHKKTKLKRCGYKRSRLTLLNDQVAMRHANRILARFGDKWEHLPKSTETKRLRFLTVLGSVEKVDVTMILGGVESLERDLRAVLKPISGIDVLGAFEIEIFNLSVLEKRAKDKNERRKLTVLKSMMPTLNNTLWEREKHDSSYALIHVHALVDLGERDPDGKQDDLEQRLKMQFPGAYRVELKKTFEDQPIRKNLMHIANYLTKGGNESLRYNAKFGRDDHSADWLEHQIWRQGGSGDKKRNSDPDAGVEDARSLSVREVQVLAESVDKLMDRHSRREGYLFKWNDLIRNRTPRRRIGRLK